MEKQFTLAKNNDTNLVDAQVQKAIAIQQFQQEKNRCFPIGYG
jgi:hypothetical protein